MQKKKCFKINWKVFVHLNAQILNKKGHAHIEYYPIYLRFGWQPFVSMPNFFFVANWDMFESIYFNSLPPIPRDPLIASAICCYQMRSLFFHLTSKWLFIYISVAHGALPGLLPTFLFVWNIIKQKAKWNEECQSCVVLSYLSVMAVDKHNTKHTFHYIGVLKLVKVDFTILVSPRWRFAWRNKWQQYSTADRKSF